jgi:hypothetical protein
MNGLEGVQKLLRGANSTHSGDTSRGGRASLGVGRGSEISGSRVGTGVAGELDAVNQSCLGGILVGEILVKRRCK